MTRIVSTIICLLAIALAPLALAQNTQQPRRDFRFDKTPVGVVLPDLAARIGLSVSFSPNVEAMTVSGELKNGTVDQAILYVLQTAHLEAVKTGEDSVYIRVKEPDLKPIFMLIAGLLAAFFGVYALKSSADTSSKAAESVEGTANTGVSLLGLFCIIVGASLCGLAYVLWKS